LGVHLLDPTIELVGHTEEGVAIGQVGALGASRGLQRRKELRVGGGAGGIDLDPGVVHLAVCLLLGGRDQDIIQQDL